MEKKGLFVTFEGGEGAGKSTLACRLRDALKAEGCDVIFTREPGGTPLGNELRSLLLTHKGEVSPKAELFLFLASRIQHLEEIILPALARGAIVLCDRFTDSTIAYQGVARGLGMDYVSSCCKQATANIVPDITFYIDIDPKQGLARTRNRSQGNMDRLESEALAFHEKVRSGFQTLARQNPARIITLDGTLDPDSLFQVAYESLKPRL